MAIAAAERRPATRLATVRAFVRWDDWADSKIPFFLVCMSYAALRTDARGLEALRLIAALLLLLCSYAVFGHLVNDFSDREADRAAGKRKLVATLSEPAALIAVVVPAVAALAIAALAFARDIVLLTALACLLAAIYSLPPVRLKERGVAGWIAAALATRTLPAAMVFEAFGLWDAAAVAFCVFSTLIGLAYIITHQIHDLPNDLRAGVRTVATNQGAARLRQTMRYVLWPLAFSFWAAVATMAYTLPVVGVVALVYVGWMTLAWRLARRLGMQKPALSFWTLIFADHYAMVYWPLLLAVLLVLRDPSFLLLLALTVLWQSRQLKFEVGIATRLWQTWRQGMA